MTDDQTTSAIFTEIAALKDILQSGADHRDTSVVKAIHGRLDSVCASYLKSSGPIREQMRTEVSKSRPLLDALLAHSYRCAELLHEPSDREYLRTGLASIALQDNRIDFRDTYFALGALYLAAIKAGIQPSLELYKVGSLASESSHTSRPKDSTRHFLQAFEESAFFKAEVQPKLKDL